MGFHWMSGCLDAFLQPLPPQFLHCRATTAAPPELQLPGHGGAGLLPGLRTKRPCKSHVLDMSMSLRSFDFGKGVYTIRKISDGPFE